ncbi:MAG: GAF domain-containing protein [Sphingomonadales bacterium]|jgi:L-methionine (R)-S-oxide reductase
MMNNPTYSEKENLYQNALLQIEGLIESEKDQTAGLANVSAVLKNTFHWWWVGFYLVKNNELVLGPFQGPVACTRIAHGKGVCGTSWAQNQSIVVEDVHAFPGHIACSAESNSEIVIPIRKNGSVVAVLDADSEHFSCFDETDRLFLEKICATLENLF